MRKFLLPVLFFVLFILESLFVQFLPGKIFGRDYILAPHFLFIAILFLTIYVGKMQGLIYAFIFGLLFDVVYTEILGIYLALYPIVAYIVSKIMHLLQVNIFVTSFVTLIGIALLELGVYGMDTIIHITNLDFLRFINTRFYPTLILSACFLILFSYPLKRLFEKHRQILRDE